MNSRLLICLAAFLGGMSNAAEIQTPEILNPNLQISLYASDPDIVTPIGAAVDAQSNLFVIESHTHHAAKDYAGPKYDRVKLFKNADRDGKPDEILIFGDSLYHAMSLAFSPRGELYLVHRNGVLILHDRDRNGVSEAQTKVLELKTDGNYPHNGLGGISFSADGWLYVGLGENLGKTYTLAGSDGSTFKGGGEGGSVFRCRPDGSRVELVATGIWNPFALEFDRQHQLFCVDNDPDSRPPCRLLHIVPGADFGYQFRYGRSGLHPFQAWNGELPGTLPMVAGTGEAPSGILAGYKTTFPGLQDALLVTSWGDHFLELYRPKAKGASWEAKTEILARGGESFRPVGIVNAPDGAVYITDWVERSYPVHGKGRIWRLSLKPGVKPAAPQQSTALEPPNPATKLMDRLLQADSDRQFRELRVALTHADPFLRSAAITALGKPVFRAATVKATEDKEALVRLGALLALRRSHYEDPAPLLKRALGDTDEEVRLMALLWTGEAGIKSLRPVIDAAFRAGTPTVRVFEAYLATVELLEAATLDPSNPPNAKATAQARERIIDQIARDAARPESLRALAIAMFTDPQRDRAQELLINLARTGSAALQLESLKTLASSTNQSVITLFKSVALDKNAAPPLRAEAVLAYSRQSPTQWKDLVPLLDASDPSVQIEAARALRSMAADAEVKRALQEHLNRSGARISANLSEQLRLGVGTAANRPADAKAWDKALATPGDIESGRRIFFSSMVSCAKCHRVQGRGGKVGPDLSTIARSSSREKLIQSILEPSREIAPQFEGLVVETKDGTVHTGVWVNRLTDALVVNTVDSGIVTIPIRHISSQQTSQLSLMPAGLEQALSVQDFRDLLSFLLSQK